MQQFGTIFRFLSQLTVVVIILLLEYPLGAPIFSLALCLLWFARKSWLEQLLLSILVSLAIALIYPLSWFATCIFLIVCFYVVLKILKHGWGVAAAGLAVFIASAIFVELSDGNLFSTTRSTLSMLWRVVWLLLTVFIFFLAERKKRRHL